MVDVLTSEQRSRCMSRIRSSDTAPELAVRRACRALGMHYTTRNRDLPGSPDLANRSRRWAIFVHGCYWHRHRGCVRASTPKTNVRFWLAKFASNVERDRKATAALRARGYSVLTLWQCEVESLPKLERRLTAFTKKLDQFQSGKSKAASHARRRTKPK